MRTDGESEMLCARRSLPVSLQIVLKWVGWAKEKRLVWEIVCISVTSMDGEFKQLTLIPVVNVRADSVNPDGLRFESRTKNDPGLHGMVGAERTTMSETNNAESKTMVERSPASILCGFCLTSNAKLFTVVLRLLSMKFMQQWLWEGNERMRTYPEDAPLSTASHSSRDIPPWYHDSR
jgi:hypothetical protein